jgi:hypothetical protein
MKIETLITPEKSTEHIDRTEWLNLCRKAGKPFTWGLLHRPSRIAGEPWPEYAHRDAAEIECILPE